jgi:hypothetical protein
LLGEILVASCVPPKRPWLWIPDSRVSRPGMTAIVSF